MLCPSKLQRSEMFYSEGCVRSVVAPPFVLCAVRWCNAHGWLALFCYRFFVFLFFVLLFIMMMVRACVRACVRSGRAHALDLMTETSYMFVFRTFFSALRSP